MPYSWRGTRCVRVGVAAYLYNFNHLSPNDYTNPAARGANYELPFVFDNADELAATVPQWNHCG